jgi:large subunit ribosomal protein L21
MWVEQVRLPQRVGEGIYSDRADIPCHATLTLWGVSLIVRRNLGAGRRHVAFCRPSQREKIAGKLTMYAVIKTGGKQYRVAADEKLTIEKIAGDAGAEVVFTDVLMLGGDGLDAKVGTPAVPGAKVVAEVVEQGRAAKVIAFKKRRRKNSRRKRGHRQHQTVVRIKEIVGA